MSESTHRRCPTCHGSGLVWRGTNTKPRYGLNADPDEARQAAFRCPTCPDDGSGNCVGTGVLIGSSQHPPPDAR